MSPTHKELQYLQKFCFFLPVGGVVTAVDQTDLKISRFSVIAVSRKFTKAEVIFREDFGTAHFHVLFSRTTLSAIYRHMCDLGF